MLPKGKLLGYVKKASIQEELASKSCGTALLKDGMLS